MVRQSYKLASTLIFTVSTFQWLDKEGLRAKGWGRFNFLTESHAFTEETLVLKHQERRIHVMGKYAINF